MHFQWYEFLHFQWYEFLRNHWLLFAVIVHLIVDVEFVCINGFGRECSSYWLCFLVLFWIEIDICWCILMWAVWTFRLSTVRKTTSVSFTFLLVKSMAKQLEAFFLKTALCGRWGFIFCFLLYSWLTCYYAKKKTRSMALCYKFGHFPSVVCVVLIFDFVQ